MIIPCTDHPEFKDGKIVKKDSCRRIVEK